MCWCLCDSKRYDALHIEKLNIKDFRNLEGIELQPSARLNIVTGSNGQGKTSLIEAVYVLITGSSFRSGVDSDLVRKGSQGYQLACWYDKGGRSLDATLVCDLLSGIKKLKINQKKASFNHADRLNLVCFTPDDLFLVKGLPGKRRAFLDFLLSQLSADYSAGIQQYRSVLKKRNEFIKSGSFSDKIREGLDPLLVEQAARVILARVNITSMLNNIVQPLFQEFDPAGEGVAMKYAVSFQVDGVRINQAVLEQSMLARLGSDREKEAVLKRTLCGPHVDDVHFYYNGQNARLYASQGQQRSLVVTLKIAEIIAFYRVKQYYPVLLLDEVLAELDDEKRGRLLTYLANAPFQSFLTSVEEIDQELPEQTAFYSMQEGRLTAAG